MVDNFFFFFFLFSISCHASFLFVSTDEEVLFRQPYVAIKQNVRTIKQREKTSCRRDAVVKLLNVFVSRSFRFSFLRLVRLRCRSVRRSGPYPLMRLVQG